MSRSPFLAAIALLSSAALAQAPDWGGAARLTVALSSFDFNPATIHLGAGRPVTLHLVNGSGRAHDFSAPAFFAASTIRVEDQGLVYKGAIELDGHRAKDITLIPRAGRYPLRCTQPLHALLGMKGEIVVD